MKRHLLVLVLALVLLVTAAVPAVFNAQDGIDSSENAIVTAFLLIDPQCPAGGSGGGQNC